MRLDLPAAVVADDGQDLAGQQVEVGSVDGGNVTVALDQTPGLDHGGGSGSAHQRVLFREIWSTVTARMTRTPVMSVW